MQSKILSDLYYDRDHAMFSSETDDILNHDELSIDQIYFPTLASDYYIIGHPYDIENNIIHKKL